MAKKNSWNVTKNKASKKKEEGVEKVKRKMVRITEESHEKAKFNPHKMQLQKYIEALIQLDGEGAVDWSKYTEDEA